MAIPDNLRWAAIQMLQHWRRCGVDHIPIGQESMSQEWSAETAASAQDNSLAIKGGVESTKRSIETINRTPALELSPAMVTKTPLKPIPISPISARTGSPTDAFSKEAQSKTSWLTDSQSQAQRRNELEAIRGKVQACNLCTELACTRTQTVFGVGNFQPRVVFFGEAPGADEDRLGEPFVGAAGQLLNKILVASKMRREEVYILNSLKCRPPANRTPSDVEIENCRPFFESQLEILQPEFIVCLGAIAARSVLKSTEPIGRLRGRFYQFRGAKVLVTYHPAYLLRNEDAKKLTWADMQLLMRTMGTKS